MKMFYHVVATLALIAVFGMGFVMPQQAKAQSGSRSGPLMQQRSFEQQFWSYLQQMKYINWAPAPGQNSDVYQGQSPHGAFLKMYLNRTAVADATNLPIGSIIVKENFGADKKTLMAITVMYRAKGYDSEHNDWYWVKYNPDGTVAKAPPEKGSMPLAGKVQGCIKCHSDTAGNDFAFFND